MENGQDIEAKRAETVDERNENDGWRLRNSRIMGCITGRNLVKYTPQ